MESLLIAFGYKARHGKDTAVQAILDAYGKTYDVRRYALADALKREVNMAAEQAGGMYALMEQMHATGQLPITVQYELNADMTDPLCPLGKQRALLQWWGTAYRRKQDPFYWVRKLRDTLLEERPAIALISDMRFMNEVQFVKGCDGKLVRCDRLYCSDLLIAGQSEHVSETELDSLPEKSWDYIIQVPDGRVDELRRDACFVFEDILAKMLPPDISADIAELDSVALPVDDIDAEVIERTKVIYNQSTPEGIATYGVQGQPVSA